MIIKSLELSDFRNYETLSISFDKGTNILFGDNAQGKTNILEAIYVSATTKSHKGCKDKEIKIIQHNIDKRPHLGGNIYCEESYGITIHKYGPHIFHTSDEEVWRFVNNLTLALL